MIAPATEKLTISNAIELAQPSTMNTATVEDRNIKESTTMIKESNSLI